jgi:aspartate/methionine/tyrosine aminotransferase
MTGGATARLAERALGIAPFQVMRILAQARALEAEGRRVCHLEIGEPDFGTPPSVVEAAHRALDAGLDRYTPATGLPALRDAIAGYYRRRYGVEVHPGRIIVTPGASGALQLALFGLLDPGDGLLIGTPSYPCYRQVAALCGARVSFVPLSAQDGFAMTAGSLRAAWAPGTRALVLASPANPTGAVLDPSQLAAVHALCRERGAALIVDEIYQGLVYDAPDCTALGLGGPDLYVVNSLSKYFGMTGWRLGWVVAPEAAVPALERIAQNLFIAAPTLAQHAACAALEPGLEPLLQARRAALARRRDRLWSGLRRLGFAIPALPRGAFYVYATLPDAVAAEAPEFCAQMLAEVAVAATPGADFAERGAEREVRFAYGRPDAELDEALARMGRFLGADP